MPGWKWWPIAQKYRCHFNFPEGCPLVDTHNITRHLPLALGTGIYCGGLCRMGFHCTWSGCLRKSPLPLVILDTRRSWCCHLAAEQFLGADLENFWPQRIAVTKSDRTLYSKSFCPGRGRSYVQNPADLMTIPEEREPLGPLVSLWHKCNIHFCLVCPWNILSIPTRHLCPHILFLSELFKIGSFDYFSYINVILRAWVRGRWRSKGRSRTWRLGRKSVWLGDGTNLRAIRPSKSHSSLWVYSRNISS